MEVEALSFRTTRFLRGRVSVLCRRAKIVKTLSVSFKISLWRRQLVGRVFPRLPRQQLLVETINKLNATLPKT